MTLRIVSKNSSETERIASKLAANIKGGEVIELSSDIGGGKTTFVKGLVAGLGSTDNVSSPTFTISKEYNTPHFRVCHFDFYRMQDAGLVAHALQEAVLDEKTVCCVEWSEIVADVLPVSRIKIGIEKDPSIENNRLITIRTPEELAYSTQGINV